MGGSSQPRENPYVAQGLLAGTTLEIAVSTAGGEDVLVTRVENIDAERIEVLVPMRRLQLSPLPPTALLRASYTHARLRHSFATQVVGMSGDGATQYLQAPAAIESTQQRALFRLDTAIRPASLYRLVIQPGEEDAILDGVIVDLGEDGLCLSTDSAVHVGERLGVQAALGDEGVFQARLKATNVTPPSDGLRNYRVQCQFTTIAQADADRIARHVMRRQLELRRRHQL